MLERLTGVFRKRVAVINTDVCRKCGLCVEACPLGAIKGRPRVLPEVDEGLCIGCGMCVEACPFNAIRLEARWSKLPIATLAAVIIFTLLVGAWIAYAYLAPLHAEAQPAEASPSPAGGFNVPYTSTPAGGVPVSYYEEIEEEAGTSGG